MPFDPDTPDQSASARNPKKFDSLYDPQGGMAFRALHFLDTQIFVDGRNRKAKEALQHLDEVAVQLEQSLGEAATVAVASSLPTKAADL